MVDKKKYQYIGYKILKDIEKKEKIIKLKKLKNYEDLEFLEIGIDDGIKQNLCKIFEED